jgi:hypothetical protein
VPVIIIIIESELTSQLASHVAWNFANHGPRATAVPHPPGRGGAARCRPGPGVAGTTEAIRARRRARPGGGGPVSHWHGLNVTGPAVSDLPSQASQLVVTACQ